MNDPVYTFDEPTHTYFVNGLRVPSVTQVLAAAGLRDLSGIPAAVLENKRELGSLVDEATGLDAFGRLDEATVDDGVWPYLRAWRKFMAETGAQILSEQRRVDHTLFGYAGRLDHEAVLHADRCIIDKKTSEPNPVDGIQLAAYEAAANIAKPRPEHTRRRFGLYLRKDETYRLVEYTDKGDFSVFLAALTIAKWKMSNAKS